MTTTVLFMCPHAAGKSLLAATYFRAAANRNGLDVAIKVAGPDPDAHNMVDVQSALEEQGYTIGWHPKLIEASDTETADVIVSIGCERAQIPTDKVMVEWETPMLSDDFAGSMAAIHSRAEALAVDLSNSASG